MSEAGEIGFQVRVWHKNKHDIPVNNYSAQIKLMKDIPDAPVYKYFDATENHGIVGEVLYQNGTLFVPSEN